MGISRENGYSAAVEAFLIVDGERHRAAKTNGAALHLVKPTALPPGTEADLVIIVDGHSDSKRIILPAGVTAGQSRVPYEVAVPF